MLASGYGSRVAEVTFPGECTRVVAVRWGNRNVVDGTESSRKDTRTLFMVTEPKKKYNRSYLDLPT